MVRIAVMGYGVVGSGTVEVFYKNKKNIEKKTGKDIDIKYILDIRDFPDSPYGDKHIKDFDMILNDPEINIVVEVMGGLNPAYRFVKSCLENGKSVVSSNKELVAEKGAELLRIAKEHNVNFFFEASVGGGIPIIRPMHQCLSANEINEIAGILNGTTNFILTKMIRDRMDFSNALALAQQLGYAEKDPTADIEGHDACRKICILASLAYGKHVYPKDVHCEGISRVTLEDVAYAESANCVIKLIGSARRTENGKISAIVSPMLVSYESQLASVDDVFNAILVKGDATGEVVFYGKGAGKLPTASAVVADVIDVARYTKTNMTLTWVDSDGDVVDDYRTRVRSFYVRATYDAPLSRETAYNKIAAAAADAGVHVDWLSRQNQPEGEIAFTIGRLSENLLMQLMNGMPGITLTFRMPVMDL